MTKLGLRVHFLRGAHIKYERRPQGLLLREWRAREKILRRHCGDPGHTVSIKVGRSRTGYAIFIIRGIGEPKDYMVQIRTDSGDVVKGESLIDNGIHTDMPSAGGIRGEVRDILNRPEGRHWQFGQKNRKGRIGRQAVGPQFQGIHTVILLLRKNGHFRHCVRQAGRDGVQMEAGRLFALCVSSRWFEDER